MAMAAALWWQFGETGLWVDTPALGRAMRLAGLIALGMAVYGMAALAAGLRKHHLEKGSS